MHDLQVGFQFDLYLLSVQIVCSSYEDPNVGLEPGYLASRLASCLVGLPQQMWISKGEYELFESVDQTLP